MQRIATGDTGDEAENSPRSVFRSFYVNEEYESDNEDVWVDSMLSTSTAPGNYPGNGIPSGHWPGFAAGTTGVLNALAPRYFDTSGIVDLEVKPPILWIYGTLDPIVSNTSFYDLNYLGQLGAVPGWPGSDIAPAQEMVPQTRDVLEAYRTAGGEAIELALEGVGHTPHLERPGRFRKALLETIGYIGHAADPALPTEAIIISSYD